MFRSFLILAINPGRSHSHFFISGIGNAGPAVILFWIFLGIAFRGTRPLKAILIRHDFCGGISRPFLSCRVYRVQRIYILRLVFRYPTDHVWHGNFNEYARLHIRCQVTKGRPDWCYGSFCNYAATGFPPRQSSGLPSGNCCRDHFDRLSAERTGLQRTGYLANANLALSITITSIATLLSPFITPLLMKFWQAPLLISMSIK